MIRMLAAAVAVGFALTGAAAAQVDITDANGSTVHVGAGGDVRIRSAGGRVVTSTTRRTVERRHSRAAGGEGCPDGVLEVSGTDGDLHVAGPCRKVDISGVDNVVHVRLAPGAAANLSGTDNTLIWTLADPKGAPPHISHSGMHNQDRRG